MYSIGDVEALTGVKAHILRYWETIVPGIAPQKDFGGRRLYSQSELEKIPAGGFVAISQFIIKSVSDLANNPN